MEKECKADADLLCEWKEKQLQAYTAICLAMPDSHIHLVENTEEGDAYGAWMNIKQEFESIKKVEVVAYMYSTYELRPTCKIQTKCAPYP